MAQGSRYVSPLPGFGRSGDGEGATGEVSLGPTCSFSPADRRDQQDQPSRGLSKLTQHGLCQHGRVARANGLHRCDTLDQIRRDDDVAEAKAGEEHLAEAAREQHDAVPIEPGSAGNGFPA